MFSILLESGMLYKDVDVFLENKKAETNAEIYWFLKAHSFIKIKLKTGELIKINKNEIYHYTTSEKYRSYKRPT